MMTQTQQLHLGDVFKSRRQKGHGGLPVVSVTLNNGLVNRDTLERKNSGKLEPQQHLLIRKGDIAYNMMRMWQGACGLADGDGIVSPAYVVVTPKDDIDPLFASYCFKSDRMIYMFWAYSYGITNDRLRLYFKDFAKIPIAIPPISEQKRIGRTLATVDQAIKQMNRLIKARRELKRGLAQQLLTGQRRLPGSDGPWHITPLGQMGRCVSGGTPDTTRPEYWGGTHPWCTPTDVTRCSTYLRDTERCITDLGLKSSGANLLPPKSLVVCTRATVGESALNTVPLATNQGFKSLVFNSKYEPLFIQQSLGVHKNRLKRLANGSTFLEVSKKDFCRVELPVPELREQKRVAEVLGAADRGISLIEEKIAALGELRRGLIQRLIGRSVSKQSLCGPPSTTTEGDAK